MSNPMQQCPCCDYFSLAQRGEYDICKVCFWEDSGQDLDDPDRYSAPNRQTLRAARANFAAFGACDRPALASVLKPGARSRFECRPRPCPLPDPATPAEAALLRRLSAILFEFDPMGLDHQTDTDEYDSEARTILARLREDDDVQDLESIVHDEFCRWFGVEDAGPSSAYGPVAAAIRAAWLEFGPGAA